MTELRDAPNASKEPLLARLAATACSHDDVCRLRDLCVDAYRLHVAGTEGLRALRHDIDTLPSSAAPPPTDADAGAPPPGDAGAAAAVLLGQTTRTLARAVEKTKQCADAQGEISRRYGL